MDLLSKMFLQIRLPRLTSNRANIAARWVNNIGHALIKSIELEIGGQRIDIQTGEYLYLNNELTIEGNKKNGIDYMVGYDVDPFGEKIVYIPLCFWFNKHYGSALPLIALNMHEIKVKIHIRPFHQITVAAEKEVLGINIAHSGTLMGVLLEPKAKIDDIKENIKKVKNWIKKIDNIDNSNELLAIEGNISKLFFQSYFKKYYWPEAHMMVLRTLLTSMASRSCCSSAPLAFTRVRRHSP